MSQKPKIYIFCNQKGCDGRGMWHAGYAMAEDGTPLASHVSSSHGFIRADLGNQRLGYKGFTRDKEYDAKYPDGYEVVWVEGDELTALVKAWNEARTPEPVVESGE